MKKLLMIGLIFMLLISFSFAAVNNVCENIHVSVDNQNRYFGGNFGQEVCLNGFQPNAYFVNYKNPRFIFTINQCVQPATENNLLRFFYCGGLN